MKNHRQRGNIVVYILIAIFLTGLMIAAMTGGAKKSATSEQVSEMVLYAQGDINLIQTAIGECVQGYSAAIDVNNDGTINATDNPNPPFPLYGTGADTLANLSNGGAGTEATTDAGTLITNIRCPGAPDGQRTIFTGNFGNKFKLLSDTTTYTTQYFTNSVEGAYVRITRASSDPLWTEAITRLNTKYATCSAVPITSAGTCVNGCFYYWILRRSTSTINGGEACP